MPSGPALLILVLLLVGTLVGSQHLASASLAAVNSSNATSHGALVHGRPELSLSPTEVILPADGQLDKLRVVPLDPSLDLDTLMRSRPFIIGPDAYDAFYSTAPAPEPLSEAGARERLEQFLTKRGVDADATAAALGRYDDPAVIQIVPSPTLRASLLMLFGWDPYEATIDAILEGANPTGIPFAAVTFADIGLSGAIATLIETDGATRLIVDHRYRNEPPEQLLPVLIHESLHDAQANSHEEEVIANILDTIAYAEIVLIDPDVAHYGTELTRFNNGALLGLLNSFGRAGPGQLGIETSALGDIWIGPGLDEVNARSIRASFATDEFYAALPSGGSPGQATFTALISRFPDADTLGETPDFDDAALRVIDRGLPAILPPSDVFTLAQTLGLDLAGPVIGDPFPVPLPLDPHAALARRPFVPLDSTLFQPAAAVLPSMGFDEAGGRAALATALDRRAVPDSARATLLADYDSPEVQTLIPDPSLRAATLLLGAWQPWDISRGAILRGDNPDGVPLQVIFADLPFGIPVARQPAAILVNSDLFGEEPELLASYVVEGILLHAEPPGAGEAVAVALLGTLAYGNLVSYNPHLATGGTPWAIERNRDLLALLNSSAWSQTQIDAKSVATAASLGFLSAPVGVADILPGLYEEAESFAGYVALRPQEMRQDVPPSDAAPPAFRKFLTFAGVPAEPGDAGLTMFDDATLGRLDARMGAFLSPDDVLLLAQALNLGVAGE